MADGYKEWPPIRDAESAAYQEAKDRIRRVDLGGKGGTVFIIDAASDETPGNYNAEGGFFGPYERPDGTVVDTDPDDLPIKREPILDADELVRGARVMRWIKGILSTSSGGDIQ